MGFERRWIYRGGTRGLNAPSGQNLSVVDAAEPRLKQELEKAYARPVFAEG